MKGFIFSEFIEMVEGQYGYALVNQMINNTESSSHGIYTSISTYPVKELNDMVAFISADKDIPVNDLLLTFGKYMFPRFVLFFPQFFVEKQSFYAFLEKLHDIIHVEVRKLFQAAETPSIKTILHQDLSMELFYSSSQKMGYFALGMLYSAAEYFHQNVEISMELIENEDTNVKFLIQQK